jgi:hypothetical protein
MPFTTDDVDTIIAELGASFTPAQYSAFAAAAHAALGNCSGPGAAYRILRDLQRNFFDPPTDMGAAHEGARHYRPSKLADGPALDEDNARGAQAARTRWMRDGGGELWITGRWRGSSRSTKTRG